MRYIIKKGKIYAICNQNYSSLTGKPSINNHELAEGKSYSSEDLGIIVGPISQAEYDDMPTHNPQTIYVVYDDEIDSSSTTINYNDLDNKPQINGQVLTGNKSLSSLNIYSKEEVRNLIAAGRSILVVATKPINPTPNTLYYVETSTQSVYHVYLYDSNTQEADLGLSTIDLSDYYTKTQADNKFEILSNKVTSITESSTDTQYPSAKAVYVGFAPYDSVANITAVNTPSNDCVFNLEGTILQRTIQQRVFFGRITDTISSNSVWGKIITTIICTEGETIIEQKFIKMFNMQNVYNRIEFYRLGHLDTSYGTEVYNNRANIVWLPWYPTEYPEQNIAVIEGVQGNIGYNISGGIMTIIFKGVRGTTTTVLSNLGTLPNIPMKHIVNASMWAPLATGDATKFCLGAVGGINSSSKYVRFYGGEINTNYYGQISVPLGY